MEKIKLDPFISELLYEHDCVIIADFGGFVANYKPAYLNPAHHTLSPPSKKIAFNSSLRINDGLLASFIAENNSLPYQEACKWISRYVEESLHLLDSGKKLNIEKIGSLYYNPDRKIQFTPDYSVNYLPDAFGLTTVHSPAIRREIRPGKQLQPVQKKLEVSEYDENRKSTTGWRWLELIPAAAVFVFLFLNPVVLQQCSQNLAEIFPGMVSENTHSLNSVVEEPVIPSGSVSPADIMPSTVTEGPVHDSTANISTEPSSPVSNPVVSPEPANPHPETTNEVASAETIAEAYYLVAGCFKMEDNASALHAELLANGYPSERIGRYRGLQVVTFQKAATHAEATAALAQIKSAGRDAWVLKK